MKMTDQKTQDAYPASLLNDGLDGEKLLFEEWWGEPPTELNVLEQRSNEQALAMWVWKAWQARAKL